MRMQQVIGQHGAFKNKKEVLAMKTMTISSANDKSGGLADVHMAENNFKDSNGQLIRGGMMP